MVIPIEIPVSRTVSGAALKAVRCERCCARFVYRLERIASGGATSLLLLDLADAEARATERANWALQARLGRAVDPVPCPKCGWYQTHMISKARRERHRWMLTTGLVLLVVGIMAGIPAGIDSFGPVPAPPGWETTSLDTAGVSGPSRRADCGRHGSYARQADH
jgi:hypothetical protein